MIENSKITDNYSNDIPFEKFWSFELFLFKLIGKSLDGAFSGDNYKENYIEDLVFFFGFSLLSSFICFSMYTLYTVELSITFAAEFVPLVLSIFIVTVKASIMWFYKIDLFTILQQFNSLWIHARKKVNLTRRINKLLNTSEKVRFIYLTVLIFCGFCYGSRPYIVMLTNYLGETPESNSTIDFTILVYPLEFPFSYQTISRYIFLLIYETCLVYFCVVYPVCDALYIHLMTHLAINFSKIQSIFGPVFFVTIILNGLDLCLCELSEGNGVLLVKSLMHAVIICVQILTYCDFSHSTTEMINSIDISIYNSEWVDSTSKYKKILIFIMMRASKEFKFTAYNIITLNREQMTKV
ncbi:GSCOCT00014116001.2-RA-CDS [Cotesia congregata]|uniref:Odorant receptor n=1 Tax=Cotesia congregata TaxID=51543 RepID=A0A8J2MTK2_COTCN|nr:GSCOCT00014116001.2-RA-CDS [Cotesia congregata]CAG5108976.1 olfactory receptor 27 [Cotesia congregata]